MGMSEKPQNGMNITPDGTIYEILEDGTIKRIGKVSPDGEFEPFGGPKDGVSVRDGFIYRIINGEEQEIGRILPNGEIESNSKTVAKQQKEKGGCLGCFGKMILVGFILLLIAAVGFAVFVGYISIEENIDVEEVLIKLFDEFSRMIK